MNAITFTGLAKSHDRVRAVEPLEVEIPTPRHVARWTPSNRFADLGWSVAGGRLPPASDALVLAAWTVLLGGLAVAAYRRATVLAR